MDEQDDLEQLGTEILDLFPPGDQRELWLEWLAQLAANLGRLGNDQERLLH